VRLLHDAKARGEPTFYNAWQHALQASTLEEAFASVRSAGGLLEWHDPDRVRLRHTVWSPTFHTHPQLGELYFSSVLNRHASWLDGHPVFGALPSGERPYHCLWGDGSEISDSELSLIRAAHDDAMVGVRLEAGDVLVIDNLRVQHGRTAYPAGQDRLLGLLLSDMVPREAARQPPPAFMQELLEASREPDAAGL